MAIYKVLFEKLEPPPPLKCLTCPTMITLGTVMPYPNKIQKIYKSHDTSLEFCWH